MPVLLVSYCINNPVEYHIGTGTLYGCRHAISSGIQVGDVISTCVQLTDGSWSLASTLRHLRQLHCAWRTELGLVLLGGESSRNTSELLTGDGESEEHFPLKYETRLAVSNDKATVVCWMIKASSFLDLLD